MPLLSELREFKASFANIGGQKANLAAKKIPINDLNLPETEAEPMTESEPTVEMPPVTEAAEADTAGGVDDLNFSDLISAMPGDLSVPDDIDENPTISDEQPADQGEDQPEAGVDSEEPVSLSEDDKAGPGAEDLYFPDELLSNLSDEIEPASAADPLVSDANLDNLENFNFPADAAEPGAASPPESAEPPSQEEAPEEALDLSVFDDLGDFGDLAAANSLDLPEEPAVAAEGETLDLGDLGIPEEPSAAAEGETPDLGDLIASSDLDAFGDLGLTEEPAVAAEGESPDLGGLDLSEEPAAALESETPDLGDLGISEEPAVAAEGEPLDLGDLGIPEEPAVAAEGETLDLGDLGIPDEPSVAAEGEPLDLGDLGIPEEPSATAEGETPDLGDLGIPEEPAVVEGETPDLGDLGIPEEPAAVVEGETPDFSGFDIPEEPAAVVEGETPDFSGFDLPEEPAAADAGETPDLDDLDLTEESVAAAEGETPDLGDLDELGDFDPSGELAASDMGEPPDLDELGDFAIPEEPAAADMGEPPDLDELGDFALPEEPAAVDTGEVSDLGDLDLPEEPAAPAEDDGGMPEVGDLDDLDTFGDLDLPEPQTSPQGEVSPLDEPAAAAEGETAELDDLDNFGDFGLPDEPAAASGDETPDFDLPEESETAEEYQGIDLGNLDEQVSLDGMADTPTNDIFEDFDPSDGVGWEKEAGEAGSDNADATDDYDDMAFPDLDNIVGESQKEKAPPAAKAGKAARKKDKRKGEIPIPEKEDDIELNSSELRYLQETLSGYPLNLRIACEEIIAEQDVRPEQMVRLIRNLIRGAPARETAILASEILDRPITVPRSFEKSSVEALEAQKASFSYIFIHNFLPVMRLVTLVAIVAACIFFLTYKFVYIPLYAESIYKKGYELIPKGEYQRANERFEEASKKHLKKIWFFRYADAFIKERQYLYAEQKYEDLLRHYPRDKMGVLSYAFLETKYLRNYAKADSLLRHLILDYNPDDPEALLALGDNSLAWGEIDPSKYEDARFSYARLIDILGQQPFIMERMMKYFIRTDNLKEVLPIWQWFNAKPNERPLGAETLSELGGYFLDKQLEEVRGVPNQYVQFIDDVREILLRAVKQDPSLPEPHYNLARYYKNLGNSHEERITLEIAIREFEKSEEGSLRRITSRIDAYQRYADNLIDSREFLHAEKQLERGIELYKDAVSRRLLPEHSQQNGRLHAGLGDLEYFVKTGDMEEALRYYNIAMQNGWAPPDMRYRMGAAYYQLENWQSALENFFVASQNLPQNRRILFSLGNAALKRGDYFAAQGYYNRLLDILENHRARLPLLLPNDRPEFLDLAERLMMARNNAGVANEMLSARTGSRVYHSRAMSLYTESQRAWDSLTRDPRSMVRSGSTSLPFLNMRNVLYPRQNYEPQMFMRIDREASESSRWEQLAPPFKD
jgi:tetratricopeptide (TPR) repeat protein